MSFYYLLILFYTFNFLHFSSYSKIIHPIFCFFYYFDFNLANFINLFPEKLALVLNVNYFKLKCKVTLKYVLSALKSNNILLLLSI